MTVSDEDLERYHQRVMANLCAYEVPSGYGNVQSFLRDLLENAPSCGCPICELTRAVAVEGYVVFVETAKSLPEGVEADALKLYVRFVLKTLHTLTTHKEAATKALETALETAVVIGRSELDPKQQN